MCHIKKEELCAGREVPEVLHEYVFVRSGEDSKDKSLT